MDEHLLKLLRIALNNPRAEFKPGQLDAIYALLESPFRALVVQATGWGKSMVYFLSTKVLRSDGRGPTLVISPLLSLMRDQERAAKRLGLVAGIISSENEGDRDELEEQLKEGSIDILFVSPERLANESFRKLVSETTLARAGLVVIDEAHCISDWGHDFRPDFLRIGELIRGLPKTTSVLATTATANERVVEDVVSQIGPNLKLLRGPLMRESLRLQVHPGRNIAERLAWLDDHLEALPGSGIIYCLTIRDVNRVTDWLRARGHNVLPYHSQLGSTRSEQAALRREREGMLLENKVKALVATVALGMGFDKPDLGFVVHYQSPGNLVAYYQQIGRAGRAIADAVAILFLGDEDDELHEWFIENARPSSNNIQAVLDALDEGPRTTSSLAAAVNLPEREIAKVLKTLSAENPSPLVKVQTKYQRTPIKYVHDFDREEELARRRGEERQRFMDFAASNSCLMERIALELDDSTARPCGKCRNCLSQTIVPSEVRESTLQSALEYLNRSELPIEPRKRWPNNILECYGFNGPIGGLTCDVGLALSLYGDPGAARLVKIGKAAGSFEGELVQRSADAIRRSLFTKDIEWVCCVPSQRSTSLVPDFAKALANALNLPFVDAVTKVRETEPQKGQRNSSHKAKNLDCAFATRNVPEGRALLVDDVVDSRWTFTIIGALLIKAGAASVVPFALASSRGGGDDD